MIHIQNPVYYRKFRHIQTYSRPFQTFSYSVAYLEPCVTLTYSKPYHFQNPNIFRTQDKFRTLSRHIQTYPERCVTLEYREHCHNQNFRMFRTRGIFRILVMLGHSSIFRHTIIVIIVIIILIVHTFQRNLKRHVFDCNDVNFNARPSLLKNTRSLKIA